MSLIREEQFIQNEKYGHMQTTVIIARHREKIIEIYKKMEGKAGKIRIEINERKTKCTIPSAQRAEGSRKT
jgi:ribosomal protein L25 (general stress protein Ctc)